MDWKLSENVLGDLDSLFNTVKEHFSHLNIRKLYYSQVCAEHEISTFG